MVTPSRAHEAHFSRTNSLFCSGSATLIAMLGPRTLRPLLAVGIANGGKILRRIGHQHSMSPAKNPFSKGIRFREG